MPIVSRVIAENKELKAKVGRLEVQLREAHRSSDTQHERILDAEREITGLQRRNEGLRTRLQEVESFCNDRIALCHEAAGMLERIKPHVPSPFHGPMDDLHDRLYPCTRVVNTTGSGPCD